MQEDKTPKIFISYSWSSEQMVLDLAQRLMSHGVEVVLDKWDLKEGQDKYAFMERCVNDPDISKVLMVCDKQYAEKANNRTGGVGDETVIISSEIYGNMKQEKFIPIIAEKDEEGQAYVPTYIKSRIYIDLSDDDSYESEYEKLLRNIYNKPQISKPKLGKKPEWLDEEKSDFFPMRDIIKQIKGSNTDIKRKSCIARFRSVHIELLKTYFKKGIDGAQGFEAFISTKQVRDLFLDFVEVISEVEIKYADLLTDIFEELYNKLGSIKTFEPNTCSCSECDLDVFKNYIWESFICVIAYMRHIEDYEAINTMVTRTYFLESSVFGGQAKPGNYANFRYHSRLIEEMYKPTTEDKRKYTLLGDVICNQREKLPIYSKQAIAGADLFLYQIFNAFDLAEDESGWRDSYWFPTFYVYAEQSVMEWPKLKSRRFCKKMFSLFGVKSIEELKECIEKCKYDDRMKYSGSFDAAPAILNYIKLDEIGSLN